MNIVNPMVADSILANDGSIVKVFKGAVANITIPAGGYATYVALPAGAPAKANVLGFFLESKGTGTVGYNVQGWSGSDGSGILVTCTVVYNSANGTIGVYITRSVVGGLAFAIQHENLTLTVLYF